MNNMKNWNLLALSTLLLSACGDANYRTSAIDDNFGKSVKHMVQAQILNPHAAQNPPSEPPKHLDGYAGENTLEAFREGFSKVETTQRVDISAEEAVQSEGN